MEIVQFRGKTGLYLEAPPGSASFNLFKMAREGLGSALRQAAQQVARGEGPVKAEGLRVRANGGVREVGFEVIPIGPAERAKDRHYLILFFEARARGAPAAPAAPARVRARGPKAAGERVAQLTEQLADAHQHLLDLGEEHEAAIEEVRVATEEAQSGNEELQSTNEELETAREELQATNEELTTVNDELNSRNVELGQLGNDLTNVLTSVHVPIIMVGDDLRIRRITPVTERILNVAPGDVGRPIGDLRLSVEIPDLEPLLRDVIETLTTQEREVEGRDGHWYSVRIRPYRTADNKIDGAVISFIDVDATKRGLEQAKEARDEAQAIVATVRGPLVILDAALRVVTANASFYESFEVAAVETERRPIFDLGNRQWDIPRLRVLLEELLPRESVIEDFEVEHDFETIGRRTMLLNARRVLSATGQPTVILLAIEDVTERRRLAAALGQLGNDLTNVLTSVHVPIIMVGDDLRIRRITPVTERILNVAPGDVGRPIGDLRLSVEIPDLEPLLRDVIETLTTQEREVEGRDGHWYSVRIRPYRTADNKIDGAVISFIDVDATKRGLEQAKEARDEAQAIVATVRGPLVILDAALRVVTANASFYESFEVAAVETERRPIFDLGNRQWDIPRLRVLLEELLPRESVIEDFEVEHDFETIGRRTMLLNARRVLSATGQPTVILLAIEDVTERRRLDAARTALLEREQAVRAEAESASQAKDRFLAILSHELRTPLTAMLGWSRVLRTGKLDPDRAARALEAIERNTLLQARLIEDLLDMSRIVAGTLRLDGRPVMVAPAVEAALAAVQPVADAKGVRLESRLDVAAGPVRGDSIRLQQIVSNLVSNAIKFTLSGGRVEVHLARRESTIELRVTDTGKGVTAERLPHIFSRFGAAHTTSQSQGGMGLGLAIVRHLVDLHDGTVQAASAGPGRGATFTVTIPLTDERPDEAMEAGGIAASGLASARLPALDGIRVLVVDDDADARELFATILSGCGAEVTVVGTARTALEALEKAPFDVLISDIGLPEDDGYDLIRKVRALAAERGGRIPALALTAYARIEDRATALAAGYQQHAAKPIEPADLAAAVATLAGRAEGERCE
jgi:signal transduction histidine kinase/ActR/RegA family two-component response regulator